MINISQRQRNISVRLFTGILVLATVTACTKDEATDYCKNHYVYHFEHVDQLSTLDVNVSESGLVAATLILEGELAQEYNTNRVLQQSLMTADNIYTIKTEGECAEPLVMHRYEPGSDFENWGDLAELKFESQCTAGAKINQVDVALFDTIPELDEIEATIKTPATSKYFAISRQCDGAIFRLAKKQDIK